MKLQRLTRRNHSAILALAIVGLLAPGAIVAQEKGATRLMQFAPRHEVQAAPKTAAPMMTCPKCKDSWVTVIEKTGKAVEPERKHWLQKHECPGCSTVLVAEGHGKAKTTRWTHQCSECNAKPTPHAPSSQQRNSQHALHQP